MRETSFDQLIVGRLGEAAGFGGGARHGMAIEYAIPSSAPWESYEANTASAQLAAGESEGRWIQDPRRDELGKSKTIGAGRRRPWFYKADLIGRN